MTKRRRRAPLPDAFTLEGCISLVTAFWRAVHDDLRAGNVATFQWLYTPAYAGWVAVCHADTDPIALREHLLTTFWPKHVQRPPAPPAGEPLADHRERRWGSARQRRAG